MQNENIVLFSRDLPDAACSSCQNVDKIFDWNKPWHDLENFEKGISLSFEFERVLLIKKLVKEFKAFADHMTLV